MTASERQSENGGTQHAEEYEDERHTQHNGHNGDDDVDVAFPKSGAIPPLSQIRIWNAALSPWSKIAEETVAAILKSGRPVFKRGYALVEPISQMLPTNDEPQRWVKQCCLVPINVDRMIMILSKWVACYYTMVERGRGQARHSELVPVHPPRNMVGILINMMHWGLPDCVGIVNSPTMRPDGSLLTEQGLDAETGLYAFWPDDMELPDLPEKPTKADAEQALTLLQELIAECAFDKKDCELNRSVALAAMFTVVLRGAFPLAPLFLFHKPEPGTGGSYLVKIISTIASGREAVPLAVSRDSKEFDKELSAAAVMAKPILNLNNVTFDLESPLLSQIISEGEIDVRPFGKNTETITCNCRSMTIIVNGNNIRIVGELVRRCLTSRLNTYLERPETKQYNGKPLSKIVADRGKYVAAILTIVRAYLLTDKTVPCEKLNGFEGWSKFVQQPLVWLNITDPVTSQKEARKDDPERSSLHARVMALKQYFHSKDTFTARDIYNEMLKTVDDTKAQSPELLDAFSRDTKPMSIKSIGRQLVRDEDRIVAGFHIKLVEAALGESKSYRIEPRPEATTAESYGQNDFDYRFFTESPEPFHACEHCKRKTGEIFLIREKHGGVMGHALHRACAEAFYDPDAF